MTKRTNSFGKTQTGFGFGSKTSFLFSNLFLFAYLVLRDELDPEYLIFMGLIPSMAIFTIGVTLYVLHRNQLITRILYGKKSNRKFKGKIPRECPTCGTLLDEDELILISKKKVRCPECEGIFKGNFKWPIRGSPVGELGAY